MMMMMMMMHPTYNTDSTSSRMIVTLSSVYQVITTNMTPSYKTINSITQFYIYAWSNSVVIVLGKMDGHNNHQSTLLLLRGMSILYHPYQYDTSI
mmetsp:Transcript_18423/g.20287  ORF Transcript_18423/g.20287 Transcript_18423/m.20287 type:complete len:95 (+) Transcript_18423:87-371(+)